MYEQKKKNFNSNYLNDFASKLMITNQAINQEFADLQHNLFKMTSWQSLASTNIKNKIKIIDSLNTQRKHLIQNEYIVLINVITEGHIDNENNNVSFVNQFI